MSKTSSRRSKTEPAPAPDTASRIEAFRRDGFVVVPGLFDAEEMRQISAWTDELQNLPEVPGRQMMYFEPSLLRPGERVLQRIENFCPFHEGFAALCDGDKLRGSVSRLFGEPAVLFKDKINFKLPGGAGFAPHQDAPAYVDFGVEHHLTVMIPVDAFTRENGCLEMARDACARVFLPQNPDGTVQDAAFERLTLEPLLAEPGDAIVFDAWVPHRSGPNRSAGPRRSYYLTFNPISAGDRRAAYYARKRECFPPEYEREPGVDYAARGRQFNLGNPFD
jgi:hypothetical protein